MIRTFDFQLAGLQNSSSNATVETQSSYSQGIASLSKKPFLMEITTSIMFTRNLKIKPYYKTNAVAKSNILTFDIFSPYMQQGVL